MKKKYFKNAIHLMSKIKQLCFYFCLIFLVQNSFGQTQILTSSGTFVVPCDVTTITVKVWGGGGAGGGSNSNNNGGAGGGAGGYSSGVISVTGGQIISYTVGAGGVGSVSANGGDGGSSVFLGLTANGGNGGTRNSGAGAIGGTASGGTIVNTQGESGTAGGNRPGGNGGDAPSGGSGGLGRTNNNGNDGATPGGGGGGGERGGGGNRAGGDGGSGQIELTYTSTQNLYCTPSYNWIVEPITNVTFAGINNTTSNLWGGNSLETFCSPSATVVQGSMSNSISVQGNTGGNYTDYVKAYVDWDQNGVFGNNSNEIFDLGTISNSSGIDGIFTTGNITVPSTALIGSTKMRIVMTYYLSSSNNPCFIGNDWGQAEDYVVNVTSALPVITSLGSAGDCVGGTITINGTNLSGATSVLIGGTSVASITSNSATQIVAVVGSGTTGTVTVTNASGTSAPSSATFTVYAMPIGGDVDYATSPICYNASTTLNLSGYTGNVVRWEKRLNSASTWTTVANTTNTLTETPTSAGTWEYRALVGNGSCTSVYSASRSVVVAPELSITLGTNPVICRNTTSASLTYSATTGSPTNYYLTFDAAALAAGMSNSANYSLTAGSIAISVPYSIAAGVYNASLTVNTNSPVCSSISYPISVTVSDPAAPTGSASQTFCSSSSPTIANLVATGTVVKWYNSASGGSVYASSAALSNNTHYYASQTISGCESTSRLDVTASVTTAASIGSVSGTNSICMNTNVTFTANTVVLGAGAGSWSTSDASVATVSGGGSVASVSPGTAIITYTITGACNGTVSASRTITINAVSSVGSVSGATTLCVGSTGSYTANSVVLSGGTGVWSSTNTSAATVDPSTGVATAVGTGYTLIRYSISGGCGSSQAQLGVNVSAGTVAGSVSGGTTICSGQNSGTLLLMGHTGAIIKWQKSVSPFSIWSDFAHTNTSYNAVGLTETTRFRAVVKNGLCNEDYSNYTTVTVNNPAAPTGLALQKFCNTAPTVASLVATGTGVKWYAAATGGTALASTVALSNNTHYYASQTISGCEGTSRLDVEITITNNVAPTVGTRTHPTCAVATGSVVLSGLPSGAWALTQDPGSITTTGTGSSTTVSGLSAGTYNFSVIDANNGTGLNGDYFSNMTPSGTPTVTRTDVSVNYDWGGGSPDSSIPADGFSVRWSGQVQALYSETYTFSTISDDGVRLWVNGVQIINNWTDHGPTTDTGTIALTAGVKYSIVLEYYENGGGALCQLIWNSTSQGMETIPQSQLFPSSGCAALLSADVVINAQPATPAAPLIGTITNIDCVNATGSVVLNGLPASGSWTINPGAITGTGTSHTITGLAGGSYVYTVTNASGCTSAATSAGGIVISNNAAVTWNGTAWSNGTGPTSASNIIFNGNYSSTGDLYGCSCEVSTGTSVAFNSGDSMIITNQVRVLGTGTLSFDDTASLVQINNTPTVANSGVITYTRITTPISNFDYTYWSSPVVGQILYDVSPLTLLDKFYSYNSFTNNWQQENVGGAMTAGTGYIIRGPQTHMAPAPPSAHMVNFSGAPHNGIINKAIGGAGSSVLIGNPYPSAIDADTFINANTAVIDGTLYFWTHNTSIQLASNITNGTAGSGTYAYTSDDYAAYNLTGGVGTAPAPSSTNAGSVSTIAPTGNIAAGQAFFTSSVAAGNVVFNNGMRIGGGGSAANNSQFFKMASSKTNKVIEKNRLWLDLYNSQGAFKQTLIGYITGATNDYENAYDGESYNSNAYLDFYSVTKDKNLVVQGRALPFVEEDEVPIGFTTKVAGTFEIAMSKTDGLLTNKNVFLKDKLLNTTHNLKTKPYSFTTEKGAFDQRFVIVYADKTLATDDFEELVSGVVVSTKNKEIQIKSVDELIDKVFVYDFTGKLIYTKTGISNTEHKISNLIVGDKALIVKIIFENGGAVSKKVIY